MQFAFVESQPGLLEPMILTGVKEGEKRLLGRRLDGESVSVGLEHVVHVGLTGENERPNMTFQFCPTWLNARMRAAGYQPQSEAAPRRLALAANPEEKIDENQDASQDTPATRSLREVQGAIYQTSDPLRWTCKARNEREKKEAVLFRQAMKGAHVFSALQENYDFGYYQIQAFLERHGREQKLETFFWGMVFSMLTANEGTATAERNMRGIAPLIKRAYQAKGGFIEGMIEEGRLANIRFDEVVVKSGKNKGQIRKKKVEEWEGGFKGAWVGGFRNQKWRGFNTILASIARVSKVIQEALAAGIKDQALRDLIARSPGGPPDGLGLIKFSFAMELWGQDVACLDRWMFRALGAIEKQEGRYFPRKGKNETGPLDRLHATNEKIKTHNKFVTANKKWAIEKKECRGPLIPSVPWEPFSEGAYLLSEWGSGGGGMGGRSERGDWNETGLKRYAWYERLLMRSEYYAFAKRENAPNPLARAHWTMWEDILRRHPSAAVRIDKATHRPIFVAMYGERAVNEIARQAMKKHFEKRGMPPPHLFDEEGKKEKKNPAPRSLFSEALAFKIGQRKEASHAAKRVAGQLSVETLRALSARS